MKTETLELKHLAPYLPYDICMEVRLGRFGWVKRKLQLDIGHDFKYLLESGNVRLHLRPLSDLENEIEFNGEKFVPIEYLEDMYYTLDLHKQCKRILEDSNWINHCDYLLIQDLLEWHFDIFGLIDSGLAIDISSLKDSK